MVPSIPPRISPSPIGSVARSRSADYKAEMIQQYILHFLATHPEIAKQHSVVRSTLAGFVYEVDGRAVGVDLQKGPPGQQAKLVIVDGSLRFPFEEFLMLNNACASQTANLSWLVHEVPKEQLLTFNDADGERTTDLGLDLSRRDAMRRATEEATQRGQAASDIKERERRESRARREHKGRLSGPRWDPSVSDSLNAASQASPPPMSPAWPYPPPHPATALILPDTVNFLMQSKSHSQLKGLTPPQLQPPQSKNPVQPHLLPLSTPQPQVPPQPHRQRQAPPAKTLALSRSDPAASPVLSQRALSPVPSQVALSSVPSQSALSPASSPRASFRSVLASQPFSTSAQAKPDVLCWGATESLSRSDPLLSPSPSQRALSPSPSQRALSPLASPSDTFRPALAPQPFSSATQAKLEGLCWGAPKITSRPDTVLSPSPSQRVLSPSPSQRALSPLPSPSGTFRPIPAQSHVFSLATQAKSDGLCWRAPGSTASTATSSQRPLQADMRPNGAHFAEPSAALLLATLERRAVGSAKERDLRSLERFPDDISQGMTKSPSQLTVLSQRSEPPTGFDETAIVRPPDEAAGGQVGSGFSFSTISGAIAQEPGDSKSFIRWGGGVIAEEADHYFYTDSPVAAVAQVQGVRAQLGSVLSLVEDMHYRRRSARDLAATRKWPVASRLVRALDTLLAQVTLQGWRSLLRTDPLRRHIVSSPVRRLGEAQRDDMLQHLREKHAELATRTAAMQVESAEIGARLASAEEVLSNSTAYLASYNLTLQTPTAPAPAHIKAQIAIQNLLHDVDPAVFLPPQGGHRP